jgi:glycosyltransferase involved in cell wall biosynthesis
LIEKGVSVTLLITGGYNSYNEFKQKGLPFKSNKLAVKYLIPAFNTNIWFRRINTYLLHGVYLKIIRRFSKSYFKADFNIVWLTFENNVLAAYNANKHCLKYKSFLELNEYNDLHEGHVKLGNKLQLKKAEKENKIFLDSLKFIDLLGIMTKNLIEHYKPLSHAKVKILHLPMTVNMSRFGSQSETEPRFIKPYIAYTGTFNNAKDGVDILIRSFIKISDKFPDHKLYMAGFYHYDVAINDEIVNKSGIRSRIINIGVLQKDEIPTFLQQASLLVMARPDSRQAQGGFPTKLGEYLATGNPVCVTKVGEIHEYLIDNESAFLAEPGDIDSFADAMERALSDIENARRIGLNGKIVAEKTFNTTVQAARLYKFFEENIEHSKNIS